MTVRETCPDCGVGVGEPHVNACDVEPCSVCGGQQCSCECKGHDPTKSVWTGAWPFKCKNNDQKSPHPITSDGFVIYGLEEALRRQQGAPQRKQEPPPREYPDHLLERNARCAFRTGFIEPVFSGGQMTGDFRACRRCPDGAYEMGQFTSREEALGWAKRYEKR